MTTKEINEAIARLNAVSQELEDIYVNGGGEVTPETEALEADINELVAALLSEGIDDLGRWLKSRQDAATAARAERDTAARRVKSLDKSVDYVRQLIRRVLDAAGKDKAKGTFYSFTSSDSVTTTVNTGTLEGLYQEMAEQAMRNIGIPSWVTVKLGATKQLAPEGEDLSYIFQESVTPTVTFRKPRANKDMEGAAL